MVRWLQNLHDQERRRSSDGMRLDESFNPSDLGAMLMSVAGFTLPSKEELEQSLNVFFTLRWFTPIAALTFLLTCVAVVFLGMHNTRIVLILKEAMRSSRKNLSANTVKSLWVAASTLVTLRELVKAIKRRVVRRRLKRHRRAARQQHLQQHLRNASSGSDGGASGSETATNNKTARRLEQIAEGSSFDDIDAADSSQASIYEENTNNDSKEQHQQKIKGNLPRRSSMVGLFVKESRKHSHQEAFFDVANERTLFKDAGVDNPDVVQKLDYEKFRDRLATGELSSAAKKKQQNQKNMDKQREDKFSEDEKLPKCDYGEWQEMMRKEDSESGSTYVAWRHILPYGGTEYPSKSTFQNCTPEELCDFFNSDQTRKAWDPLLIKSDIIERDVNTGADLVHWERKLPVISNRDYVFSRRTWTEKQKNSNMSSGLNKMDSFDLTPPTTPMKGKKIDSLETASASTSCDKNVYYTITKGMSHPSVPKSKRILRVDPYYSAWKIEAVPDFENADEIQGLKPYTAAQCTLIHFEEQQVQHDVARLAVRHGMWSVVRAMLYGFRAFQRVRETKFIEQDSGGFNRRDQTMLEDAVHEKQVGFRMRKELGMAMKTFVVPMFFGFLLAKQTFGGKNGNVKLLKCDLVGNFLQALEKKINRDSKNRSSSKNIVIPAQFSLEVK